MRGIVVWEKGKKSRDFILIGSKTVPPVAIRYRPPCRRENLLHTYGILPVTLKTMSAVARRNVCLTADARSHSLRHLP